MNEYVWKKDIEKNQCLCSLTGTSQVSGVYIEDLSGAIARISYVYRVVRIYHEDTYIGCIFGDGMFWGPFTIAQGRNMSIAVYI